MKIDIKTLVGMARTYSFDVEPTTTIRQLKDMLCNKLHCEKDLPILCLILGEEELEEDNKTLADYNITADSELDSIFLEETFRGDMNFMGSRFIDVSNENGLKKRAWSRKAPRWRRSIRGLCLEGKCLNPACEAFNQYVIMRIGYKMFNILLDADENTTVCPICRKFVEPIKCAFNNCWWRFEGIKHAPPGSGKPPEKLSSKWSEVGDAYHYFDETSAEVVFWKHLVIETVKNKPK